jgi:translocation and assembly module TamB
VDGTLAFQLRGTLAVSNSKPLLTGLSGYASLRGLAVGKRPMGNLKLAVETRDGAATLALNGAMAGSQVNGKLTCSLKESYPMQGEIGFTGLSLSAVWPWLNPLTNGAQRPLEATAEGKVTFSGAAFMPAAWNARIEMSALEILPSQELKPQGLGLRSVGPVVFAVSQKQIRIESARFAGPETSIEATGRIGLTTGNNMYDLRIRGALNLAVLHNFEPNLTAAGESTLDATIRGSLAKPELYGRLELKKGSFYLSGVPNGIDNANGVISLSRDRATIENVTAETGGGKLTLNGFAGFGGGRPTYGLQAVARQVRVRYPQGVSTTLDATLGLSGTAGRSVLSGKVTLLRSALTQEVLATLTARSSQPLVSPAGQNELLRGMQLNVRIDSSPNARFETSLTRDIQAEADLQLRGTPYKPILLGRFTINHGETELFGTRYTITRGEISFLNPTRLEPVLNLDMETRVRGIDVTMNYSGPMDQRLRATYRSDPPLQPSEIVALLAVGDTPTSGTSQLAVQSGQLLNSPSMGVSNIIGQALAEPFTGRLQRLFGVSRIQINPRISGLGSNPEAQLTLEQRISRDITLTYVTSLAQEQQRLVRVEWTVSRQWSVLAVREANGLFGIEFQFKKQFK